MMFFVLQSTLIFAAFLSLWRMSRRILTVIKLPTRNLAGPPPESWFNGNVNQLFNPGGLQFHRDIVETYGGAIKIHGVAGDEQVYFSDPRALHTIVVKDQHLFEETEIFAESNRLVFGDGLLSSHGDQHKKQRKMLNPLFSASQMRNLTPMFYEIAHKAQQILVEKLESGTNLVDVLDLLSRTALEFIAQGGMGYTFDALNERKTNRYGEFVRKFIPSMSSWSAELLLVPSLVKIGPPAFRRWLVNFCPFKYVKEAKDVIDMMENTSKEILLEKKVLLGQNGETTHKQIGQGKDVLSNLLRMNADASEQERLPENEILGQISTLIFAAHDTTSSATARVLHMLCLHLDAQDRLRREVSEARAQHGDLSYDAIMALPYLDSICRETLRLHSPATVVSRSSRAETTVPLLRPVQGVDGKFIHEVTLAQGQGILIGIAAANRDPDTWGPDAAEWKPERWLTPNPNSIATASLPGVYSNTMTFLGGGRACLGLKFALLEMKIILSIFVESFSFSLTDETIVWNLGNLLTPSLQGKEKIAPHLPLRVSPL